MKRISIMLGMFCLILFLSCTQSNENKLLGKWEVIEFYNGTTPEEAGATIAYTFEEDGVLYIDYNGFPTDSEWKYMDAEEDYLMIDGIPADFEFDGRNLIIEFRPFDDGYTLKRK